MEDNDNNPTTEALREIVLDLIKEKCNVPGAIKRFNEFSEVAKMSAYASLMLNLGHTIKLDEVDYKLGLDKNVTTEEEAFYRSEKLSTIAAGLSEASGNSLLPFDEEYAKELRTVIEDLAKDFPKIKEKTFRNKCLAKQIGAARAGFREYTQKTTVAAYSQRVVSPARPKNNNNNRDHAGENHVNGGVQFTTPTRGVTGKIAGLTSSSSNTSQ